MVNVVYSTPHLAEYFLGHRRSWNDFYPSERWVFERVGASMGTFGHVLDVGCAVGGLGHALTEKFPVSTYTGIDINSQAIQAAVQINELSIPTKFVCGDIVSCSGIADEAFNIVASLSVADWNVDTNAIIEACWKKVAPGGRLLITLRLTNEIGINDMQKSYQYIVPNDDFEMPDDKSNLEKAPYVVLNAREVLGLFSTLTPAPSEILAYGYWGKPSATAITPYSRLAFTVLAITKPANGVEVDDVHLECHLPVEVFL